MRFWLFVLSQFSVDHSAFALNLLPSFSFGLSVSSDQGIDKLSALPKGKYRWLWSYKHKRIYRKWPERRIYLYTCLNYTVLTLHTYLVCAIFTVWFLFGVFFFLLAFKKCDGRKSLRIDLVCQWFILNGISKTFVLVLYLYYVIQCVFVLSLLRFGFSVIFFVCIYYWSWLKWMPQP